MLFEHRLIVKDAGRVRRERHTEGAFGRDEFETFKDIDVGLFDVLQSVVVGDVHEDPGIDEVREVDIAADTDDVRIVLADEAGLQDRRGIVRGRDGQVDVVVRRVEVGFDLFKGLDRLLLVLHDLDLGLFSVGTLLTAGQQQSRRHQDRKHQTQKTFHGFHGISFLSLTAVRVSGRSQAQWSCRTRGSCRGRART